MRSVPLMFNGEVRHLRYTFGSIEDIDQLMPGGFYSVFERQAGIEICHLLLWAGLQHESVTYYQAGEYLVQHLDTTPLFKTITYSLINDGWISAEPSGSCEDTEPVTLPDLIASLEKQAISNFNIKSSDFYALTPREFSLLQDNYGISDNIRAGLICATMANIHSRKSGDKVFEPKDFIRVKNEPEKKQTVQEQSEIFAGIFGGGA